MDLKETELTLGLPGELRDGGAVGGGRSGAGVKRAFSETLDLLNLSGSTSTVTGETDQEASSSPKPPESKTQLVGWPPVRASRKNAMKSGGGGGSCNFVKVAVDGAPYLRKVDLEMYGSYEQLLTALEEMFSCYGSDYLPTYEDKDGDWMMVGDVPWKMFSESCKKIRLMKSCEAVGLAPRTVPAKM
ncbi:hypothetical protein Dimus_004362 [Dionaea muscipula]